MKNLWAAKKSFDIKIKTDTKNRKFWPLQKKFTEKVVERFCMDKAKLVNTKLASHFKLSIYESLSTNHEMLFMSKVVYASAVGCLMYAKLDLVHAISVVSKFMVNLGKEHWQVVKCKL